MNSQSTIDYLNKAIRPPYDWLTKEKDTEYSMWSEAGTAYIAFQGSLSITDWFYNAMFWPTLGVHTGIYRKYKAVKSIVEAFAFVLGKGRKIVCIGHSQGAAIALLAHIDLAKQGYDVESHLFGCPKIFSIWRALGIRKYCDTAHHYQVRTDIVSYLHPLNMQAGKIIKLGKSKPVWKWKVKDHYPGTYRYALKGE